MVRCDMFLHSFGHYFFSFRQSVKSLSFIVFLFRINTKMKKNSSIKIDEDQDYRRRTLTRKTVGHKCD
ncbi:hypothetical protein BLOT_003955 [Blomia tropicalis]|nr:hypothetical protein BLOT_003955 [Blomia tropicalis]